MFNKGSTNQIIISLSNEKKKKKKKEKHELHMYWRSLVFYSKFREFSVSGPGMLLSFALNDSNY